MKGKSDTVAEAVRTCVLPEVVFCLVPGEASCPTLWSLSAQTCWMDQKVLISGLATFRAADATARCATFVTAVFPPSGNGVFRAE